MSTWMDTAFKYEGLREIKGPEHAPEIQRWLRDLSAWWSDDETPWCGVYTAAVFKESGYEIPKMYMRAKAWLGWGTRIATPVYGCIAVFERKGGGHVGFVVGYDKQGNLLVLGGNQGNAVNVSAFPVRRVIGYRIPKNFDIANADLLQVVKSSAKISHTEA